MIQQILDGSKDQTTTQVRAALKAVGIDTDSLAGSGFFAYDGDRVFWVSWYFSDDMDAILWGATEMALEDIYADDPQLMAA